MCVYNSEDTEFKVIIIKVNIKTISYRRTGLGLMTTTLVSKLPIRPCQLTWWMMKMIWQTCRTLVYLHWMPCLELPGVQGVSVSSQVVPLKFHSLSKLSVIGHQHPWSCWVRLSNVGKTVSQVPLLTENWSTMRCQSRTAWKDKLEVRIQRKWHGFQLLHQWCVDGTVH